MNTTQRITAASLDEFRTIIERSPLVENCVYFFTLETPGIARTVAVDTFYIPCRLTVITLEKSCSKKSQRPCWKRPQGSREKSH